MNISVDAYFLAGMLILIFLVGFGTGVAVMVGNHE